MMGTSAWEPVGTLAELDQLDDVEIQEGYFDGRNNEPEPRAGGNRSRSYWHGWRVGMMDAYRIEVDADHRKLVSEFVRREKAHREPGA